MIFLVNHPSWSWNDLEEAPDEVVELLRLFDAARASQARRPR